MIFNAVLELKVKERTRYVAEACGSNVSLHERVEALLRAHDADEGFLPETPATTMEGCAVAGRVVTPGRP